MLPTYRERERETETETETEKNTERDSQRKREPERVRDKQRERDRRRACAMTFDALSLVFDSRRRVERWKKLEENTVVVDVAYKYINGKGKEEKL